MLHTLAGNDVYIKIITTKQ